MELVFAIVGLLLSLTALAVGIMAVTQLRELNQRLAGLNKQLDKMSQQVATQEAKIDRLEAAQARVAETGIHPFVNALAGGKAKGIGPVLATVALKMLQGYLHQRKISKSQTAGKAVK